LEAGIGEGEKKRIENKVQGLFFHAHAKYRGLAAIHVVFGERDRAKPLTPEGGRAKSKRAEYITLVRHSLKRRANVGQKSQRTEEHADSRDSH